MAFNQRTTIGLLALALCATPLLGCGPGSPGGDGAESGGAGGDGAESGGAGGTGGAGGAGGGTTTSSGEECVIQPMTATFVGLGDPTNLPAGKADIMDGHKISQGLGYNIFGNDQFNNDPKDGNCHNAALHGEHSGVVICQGNPTWSNENYVDMAQYHTFQYEYVPGPPDYDAPGTVFYNWSGQYYVMKVPQDMTAGPDMQDPSTDPAGHSYLEAGQIFCDTQWTTDTRSVPGDGNIEDPGPAVCGTWVKEHEPESCNPMKQCIQCCDDRRAHWKKNSSPAMADDFNHKCVLSCCFDHGFQGDDPRCPI